MLPLAQERGSRASLERTSNQDQMQGMDVAQDDAGEKLLLALRGSDEQQAESLLQLLLEKPAQTEAQKAEFLLKLLQEPWWQKTAGESNLKQMKQVVEAAKKLVEGSGDSPPPELADVVKGAAMSGEEWETWNSKSRSESRPPCKPAIEIINTLKDLTRRVNVRALTLLPIPLAIYRHEQLSPRPRAPRTDAKALLH